MKHLKKFENKSRSMGGEEYPGMREVEPGIWKNKKVLESKKMKQWVLNTVSESSDRYTYFIEHPTKPTREELEAFLEENANDIFDGEVYEDVSSISEISGFKRIP